MKPYEIVSAFEQEVAEYAGARYGVGVNSCTSAIMLSAALRFAQGHSREAWLPCRTYVGVPQAIIAAGGECKFIDFPWSGQYDIVPLQIVDGARRFNRGMYEHDTLHCLSFHWGKHLKIGRGGMILTNNKAESDLLRKMRYDGRTPGVSPGDDTLIAPAWHVYMIPEDAARGLMLMAYMGDHNEDIPWDDYPDCSAIAAFKEGV